MKEGGESTKERILKVALDMFSARGYTAVSIRDIAGSAGIKESTIYYYFANKQAIFDELISRINMVILGIKDNFNQQLKETGRVGKKEFILAGVGYTQEFLYSEMVYKMVSMLRLERGQNEAAKEAYQRLMYEVPLEHHRQTFQYLVDKEIIKIEDIQAVATEYQALILYIYDKYPETQKEKGKEELSELLDRFYKRYFQGGRQ